MKILMVCLGNICRSPLAWGIMKQKVEDRKLDAIVDSAGTSAFHIGDRADKRAKKTAENHGIDISAHRGKQFVTEDFDNYDKIFVMDESNYMEVISLSRNQEDRKKVDFILNQIGGKKNDIVPDPYYGAEDGFEQVFSLLDMACDKIADSINKKINS